MESSESPTRAITPFMTHLRALNEGMEIAVILVGSVARGTETLQSDLDLLVVSPAKARLPNTNGRLHVQAFDEATFRNKLGLGDDFTAWCVRFGVPLATSSGWEGIVNSPEANVWPDWRRKITHATRRLLLGAAMLNSGDLEASTEETLYAVSHTARAVLLKQNVFPLSRPEMVQQLTETHHDALSQLLKELIYDSNHEKQVIRAQIYIKRLLVHLDKTLYRDFVSARATTRRLKKTSARTLKTGATD